MSESAYAELVEQFVDGRLPPDFTDEHIEEIIIGSGHTVEQFVEDAAELGKARAMEVIEEAGYRAACRHFGGSLADGGDSQVWKAKLSTDTSTVHHELAKLGDRISWLTQELAAQEAKRDALMAELLDAEGASSNRFVGAR
jgi:hypothetical protein